MYICGYLYPFRYSGNKFLRYTLSLGDIYFICSKRLRCNVMYFEHKYKIRIG